MVGDDKHIDDLQAVLDEHHVSNYGGTKFVATGRRTASMCELCYKYAELRPYGPNGERLCFECAMKDEETTKRKFAEQFE